MAPKNSNPNNNSSNLNINQKTTKTTKSTKNTGFTIVELLIVIIIIGVLSAIVFVSYRGITARANETTLTADLANASKKLSLYHAQYGTYPDDLDGSGCPTGPQLDTNYCIKPGSGIAFEYNLNTPSTYDLTFTKGTLAYQVTESQSPFSVNTTPITAIGSITGTPQTSQTLTAGTITPAGATVSYQWQSATTAGGTYTNISGATSNTLVLNPSNINKYIKVTVTGTGTYTGTQTSAASVQIATDANWKVVGSQVWATANVNVGTRINGGVPQSNNGITEKNCYDNLESNCAVYGGLYQWGEAMQYANTEGAQGICPAGSHIPSDAEWKILEISLGMTQIEVDKSNAYRGTDQGTQLKSGGASGLNFLFAGRSDPDGRFFDASGSVYMWSSSESGTYAWRRYTNSSEARVERSTYEKVYGFSVRCLGN